MCRFNKECEIGRCYLACETRALGRGNRNGYLLSSVCFGSRMIRTSPPARVRFGSKRGCVGFFIGTARGLHAATDEESPPARVVATSSCSFALWFLLEADTDTSSNNVGSTQMLSCEKHYILHEKHPSEKNSRKGASAARF